MPEQDAVLAITGGLGDMQQPLNLVWDILLPAMKADSLPDDAGAQERLSSKLSSLSISPVQGAASSPTAAEVSGRTYKVDANDLKVESIAVDFTETGCTVTVNNAARGEQTFPCGYSDWQKGQTNLYNDPWDAEPKRTVASGAWTADDTFTMAVRLYETPFFHTINFRFTGDDLTLETRINVAFEPPKTLVLMGHAM